MNRKRWIVGAVILAIFIIVTLVGGSFLLARLKRQPQVHQRKPISNLVYCNSHNIKPCIVSFNLDADNNMLVNILIPASSYPDFYLTISNANAENKYKCQPVDDFPTNIYCTGVEMYPGEILQFALIAIKDDTVLAEGKFPIIGLLLPNPEEEITSTPATPEAFTTETPFETPTPFPLEILTPLPTKPIAVTPTPTSLTPSYPNPSYP